MRIHCRDVSFGAPRMPAQSGGHALERWMGFDALARRMCLYHGGLRDALGFRCATACLCGSRSQLPPAPCVTPFDKATVTVVPLISWWYHWLCEAARARAGGAGGGKGRSAELPHICKSWLATPATVGDPSPCMARMSQLCSRCDVPRRQCRRRQVGRGSGLHAVLLSSG